MKSWAFLGMVGLLALTVGCSKQDEQKAAAPQAAAPQAAAPQAAAPQAAAPQAASPQAAAPQAAAPQAAAPQAAAPQAAAANPHAGMAMPPPTQAASFPNQGVVKEIIQAGTYTYLEVEGDGTTVWLASSQVDFKAGDPVRWGQFQPMRNFHSKTLDRTFPVVLFVNGVEAANKGPSAPANQGTVLQVIETTGYNYIEVETGNGKKWLASPIGPVQQGQVVAWMPGVPMQNFESKSLGRTFNEIFFLGASPTPVN